MVRFSSHAFFIGLFAIVSLTVFGGSNARAEGMIELRIEGAEGQSFRGDCTFQGKMGSAKRQKISGKSPFKALFPAKTLVCNIEKPDITGFMTVKILRGNNVEIAQANRYPFKWILVSSSGPWGNAKGGSYAARPNYR